VAPPEPICQNASCRWCGKRSLFFLSPIPSIRCEEITIGDRKSCSSVAKSKSSLLRRSKSALPRIAKCRPRLRNQFGDRKCCISGINSARFRSSRRVPDWRCGLSPFSAPPILGVLANRLRNALRNDRQVPLDITPYDTCFCSRSDRMRSSSTVRTSEPMGRRRQLDSDSPDTSPNQQRPA
jgi:hypothetical protein